MGSIIIFFIIQHIFLFCMIFWGLTWVGSLYAKPVTYQAQKQFYECGFKSISDLNFQTNLNFTLVCVFLILYDVEFTFLFPLLFNFTASEAVSLVTVICFFAFLLLALIYDLAHSAANTTI